jgi:hypothetical protein
MFESIPGSTELDCQAFFFNWESNGVSSRVKSKNTRYKNQQPGDNNKQMIILIAQTS